MWLAVREFDAAIHQLHVDDDTLKMDLACELVMKAEESGKKLKFPRGKTLDNAETLNHFPKTIVKKANDLFSQMSDEDKEAFRVEAEKLRIEFPASARQSGPPSY